MYSGFTREAVLNPIPFGHECRKYKCTLNSKFIINFELSGNFSWENQCKSLRKQGQFTVYQLGANELSKIILKK